ncbi:hypothetical protein Hanom_Chr01g00039821 [Helianthus anomalus]
MIFLQARATDWHPIHNICCILDKNYPNMEPFKVILLFMNESRIFKALTEKHKCYESHVRMFWKSMRYDEQEKTIYSAVRLKDENDKVIELGKFLKKEKRSEKFKKIRERAVVLGRRKFERPPPTDQTPIESEEKKIPRWDKKRDADPEYKNYWNKIERPMRLKMLAEKEEKRRQKARESRRSRKTW